MDHKLHSTTDVSERSSTAPRDDPTGGEKTFDLSPTHHEVVAEETDFNWDFAVVSNLAACWATYFASTFNLVVPSGAIGFIEQSFPTETSNGIWIAASVTVMNCVVQAFLGDLSDHLGRKVPLLVGMVLGLTGVLIASRATSINMIIAGQVLNGIGLTVGYLVIPLTQEIIPKAQRPRVQALSGIFAGIAFCTGSIINGAFIKHNVGGVGQGWRCGFYVGAALYAIAFVSLTFFYHPSARPNPGNLSLLRRIRNIDWLGVFLIASGLTIFLVGLESGGNPKPWVSAEVLSCLIIGFILLVAFCLWEWKGTTTGILAHSLFSHPNFAVTLALNFVGGMVLFGGQAFLPQEIIYLFTSDAILTGVYSLPFNGATIVGGIVAALIMSRTKEAKPIILGSFVCLIVGNCILLVVKPHINFAAWFFPTALLGLSVGIQTSLLLVVVTLCTPDGLIAAGASIVSSTRAFGGSIGVVIFSQIFAAKVKHYVPLEVAEQTIKAGLPPTSVTALIEAIFARNIALLEKVPGVTPLIIATAEAAVADGYSQSFRYVWYSLLPFAVVSTGVAFFLKSTKAQMTAKIAAGIQNHH